MLYVFYSQLKYMNIGFVYKTSGRYIVLHSFINLRALSWSLSRECPAWSGNTPEMDHQAMKHTFTHQITPR